MSVGHRVAVITRTKDRALLLDRCIQSVLAQDFEDWSHIIVNDGGNSSEVDGVTEKYRSRYGSRLTVLHHRTTKGMEAASNSGLSGSQSEFVTFLDDDDTWGIQFLSAMLDALTNNRDSRVKAAICQTEIVRERRNNRDFEVLDRWVLNSNLTLIRLDDLFIQNRFTNNAFLFCRSAQQEIGVFDEQLPAFGDWDFNLRFLLRFDSVVIPRVLARWHWPEQSNSVLETNSVDTRRIWYTKLINDALRGKWMTGNQYLPIILALGTKFAELERSNVRIQQQLDQIRSEANEHTNLLAASVRDYSFTSQIRLALASRFKRLFGLR